MGLEEEVRARLRDGKEGSEIIDELTADGQYTREDVSDALERVELPSEERAGIWFAHVWLGVFGSIVALFTSIYFAPLDTLQFLDTHSWLAYPVIIVAGFGVLSIWWGVMKLHDTVRSAALAGAGLVFTAVVGALGYLFISYRLYLGGLPDLLSFLQWGSFIAIGLMVSLAFCVGALYRDKHGLAWTIVPVIALLALTGMFVNDVGRYPDIEPVNKDIDSLHVVAEQVNATAATWEPGSVVPPLSGVAYTGQLLQLSGQIQATFGSYVEEQRLYGPGSSCGGLRIVDDVRTMYYPSLLLRSIIEQVDRHRGMIVDAMVDECTDMRQTCSRDTAVADQELDQLLKPFQDIAAHAERFFAPDRSLDEFAIFDCGSPAADRELLIEDISCRDEVAITIGSGREPLSGTIRVRINDMAGDYISVGSVTPGELDALTDQQEIRVDTDLEEGEIYDVTVALDDQGRYMSATAVCRGGDGFCEDCADREDDGIETKDLICTRDDGQIHTRLQVMNNGIDASGDQHEFAPEDYVVETVYRDGERIETVTGTFENETTRTIAFPSFGDITLSPDESLSMNRTIEGGPGTYRFEVERYAHLIDDPASRGNQYLLNRFEATCTIE